MYESTITADTRTLTLKLHPSRRCMSSPMAYIETPDENTVMMANDTALKARVFSSKRRRRYSGTDLAREP